MRWYCFLIALAFLSGCATQKLNPDNPEHESLSGRGQVVWKENSSADELVGDLEVESTHDGTVIIQVIKGPFLFVSGQVTKTGWSFEIPSENKKYTGKGMPPPQLSWLHLARCFLGKKPLAGWQWAYNSKGEWAFYHRGTGEKFEGYFE